MLCVLIQNMIGMYLVKCKESNCHTSLTTLCSHFLLSYGNQAMNLLTGGHDHVIYMNNLEGVFFCRKYSRRLHRDPQKLICSI